MKLFEKHQEKQHKNKDYTIIVGCGRLGASLASRFSEDGGNVLVIDEDKNSFRKLSPNYGGMVIQGDATEISVLKRAEIKNATSVIAVTNHDNTNVMVAQLAKELFHIDNVIARLYDPDRECVYRELQIDTICPVVLSTRKVDQLLYES
jgi:trk system potassium uptake protein TrkA